ncbi:hypothetical protein D9758_000850 [Tetrapyrgos nigripes]|uniref:Uncharacterized protein n=1 Tax=Tetrapyrgos nigripes TaxID=182062 RepID=A0A8H5GYT9_9AGAR|nr:hypothetical protein D9758_000850 [Tetrapyrgos nigripes]
MMAVHKPYMPMVDTEAADLLGTAHEGPDERRLERPPRLLVDLLKEDLRCWGTWPWQELQNEQRWTPKRTQLRREQLASAWMMLFVSFLQCMRLPILGANIFMRLAQPTV